MFEQFVGVLNIFVFLKVKFILYFELFGVYFFYLYGKGDFNFKNFVVYFNINNISGNKIIILLIF